MKDVRDRPRPASLPVVDDPTVSFSRLLLGADTGRQHPAERELSDPPRGPWSRLRAWSPAHPILLDGALALLLDVWVLLSLFHVGTTAWWVVVLSQLLVLPLVIRRRAPWPVFGLLTVIAAVQWAAQVRFLADAALLVALYTVAAHESRHRALIAAGVLEAGVLLASIRFAPTDDGVIASMVFLSGLVAAALFSGITLQTRRDFLASLVERAAQLERERDQQVLLAATAERTRIAREMHDVIAHSLSVIITLADGAALANPTAPGEATEAMLQVAATGRTSMSEMRRLLGVLREDGDAELALTPQPGLDRIDALIADVRAAGLPALLSVTGVPRTLPATTQSVAYRIVQEGLTNALKHADQPTRVRVELHWDPAEVQITISDDGGGGPQDPHAPRWTGHGMIGMRERAALLGGTVTAGPRTSGGWQVHTTLPLEPSP